MTFSIFIGSNFKRLYKIWFTLNYAMKFISKYSNYASCIALDIENLNEHIPISVECFQNMQT